MPILTEVAGIVKFGDIVEGVTMTEKLDEVTGLSRKVIVESQDADLARASRSRAHDGKTLKLPAARSTRGTSCRSAPTSSSTTATRSRPATSSRKIPRETTKTKDITGGLPRVAELFEARKPKDHAIIAEIDGVVSLRQGHQGQAQGRHHAVADGERAPTGVPHRQGQAHPCSRATTSAPASRSWTAPANPHDILRVLGEKALAEYLVDEVQEVYRLQGVKINDKHIETIVRQMLRRIRVTDVGDTDFLVDEQVEKTCSRKKTSGDREGRQAGQGEPLLLGITKASLSTESFISASSFQETTKVLTEAAVRARSTTCAASRRTSSWAA